MLSEQQVEQLKTAAFKYANSIGLFNYGVAIPEESKDFGFEFNPVYHEVVTELFVMTDDSEQGHTLYVLTINDNYEVVAVDKEEVSYEYH